MAMEAAINARLAITNGGPHALNADTGWSFACLSKALVTKISAPKQVPMMPKH